MWGSEDWEDEWREIIGHPGYFVSIYGEVYSPKRDRMLSQSLSNQYLQVGLSTNGRHTTRTVHSLVAEAFVPGRTARKYWVDHVDTNKLNNRADNLEWVAPGQNIERSRIAKGIFVNG